MKAGYFFAGVESQQSQLENLRLGAGLLVDVMYENAKATMKAIVQMGIRTGFALGTEGGQQNSGRRELRYDLWGIAIEESRLIKVSLETPELRRHVHVYVHRFAFLTFGTKPGRHQ